MKFGNFAEVSDASVTESSSIHMESEDDVITALEHEDERVPPIAIVVEEHDQLMNVEVHSDFNEGEVDDDDNEDEFFVGDLSGLNEDFNFEFENKYYWLTNEDLDSFFDDINDIAQHETEIGELKTFRKQCLLLQNRWLVL